MKRKNTIYWNLVTAMPGVARIAEGSKTPNYLELEDLK
jgi:hypothetical protein